MISLWTTSQVLGNLLIGESVNWLWVTMLSWISVALCWLVCCMLTSLTFGLSLPVNKKASKKDIVSFRIMHSATQSFRPNDRDWNLVMSPQRHFVILLFCYNFIFHSFYTKKNTKYILANGIFFSLLSLNIDWTQHFRVASLLPFSLCSYRDSEVFIFMHTNNHIDKYFSKPVSKPFLLSVSSLKLTLFISLFI